MPNDVGTRDTMRILTLIMLTCSLILTTACGPDYLQDDEDPYKDHKGFRIDQEAEIKDTVEHRQVMDVLLQYRQAMVNKDIGTIKRLVSENYYENAGTTNTTQDDYGAEQLEQLYELVSQHAEDVKYDVTVKAMNVDGDRASVDYEFDFAYHYKVGDKVAWDAGVEVNRLEMESSDGEWKIVSGL